MKAAALRQFHDLLDEVENQPGWRVEDTKNGWRIYPADPAKALVHTHGSGDWRAFENFKSDLRRAGYPPLQRKPKDPTMPPTRVVHVTSDTAPAAPSAPPPPVAAAPPPRDLVREARAKIQQALEVFAELDGLLGEIAGEHEAVAKVKQLFQTMLK